MENKIQKMYLIDCITIIGFMVALWIIVCGVILQVLPLSSNSTIKMVIALTGTVVVLSSTAALIAVLNHLKNKKIELYKEDITASMEM